MIQKQTHIESNREIIIIFCLIGAVILAGNMVSVFGLKTILLDDQSRYINGLTNTLPMALAKRNLLIPYPIYFFAELTTISPYLARGVIVFLVVMPISMMFFWLYFHYLRLEKIPAFVAACLPNILPEQYFLPHFMDGCYTLYGLLFAIPSLFFAIEYLSQTSLINWRLFIASLLFLISALLMDHSVFLFIPFALVFLWFSSARLQAGMLICFFGAISVGKLYYVLNYPWASSVPITPTLEVIFQRIALFSKYMLPFNPQLILNEKSDFWMIALGLNVLILFGIIILLIFPKKLAPLRPMRDGKKKIRNYSLFLIIFGLIFVIATFAPFLVSSSFGSRYAHMAGFGYFLLFVLASFSLARVIPINSKYTAIILLISLIILAVVDRNQNLYYNFRTLNRSFDHIVDDLQGIEFPRDSQIVILGPSAIGTGGYWQWSRGFLKFSLKRADIDGLLPYEYRYYDPFLMDRSYSSKMTGLDLGRPVFVYRRSKSEEPLTQKEYGLRWLSSSADSKWQILKFEKTTGYHSVVFEGEGYEAYKSFLLGGEGINISQDDIVWGGVPNIKEKERLGLN